MFEIIDNTSKPHILDFQLNLNGEAYFRLLKFGNHEGRGFETSFFKPVCEDKFLKWAEQTDLDLDKFFRGTEVKEEIIEILEKFITEGDWEFEESELKKLCRRKLKQLPKNQKYNTGEQRYIDMLVAAMPHGAMIFVEIIKEMAVKGEIAIADADKIVDKYNSMV